VNQLDLFDEHKQEQQAHAALARPTQQQRRDFRIKRTEQTEPRPVEVEPEPTPARKLSFDEEATRIASELKKLFDAGHITSPDDPYAPCYAWLIHNLNASVEIII
jgi:hypothetical protein